MAARNSMRAFGLALVLTVILLATVLMTASAQPNFQDQDELGAKLFADNCAVCHGPTGEGRIGATLAKDWPSIRPDKTVNNIIVNGVPGTAMIAWSQENGGPLNDDEIDALVNHILSWQTGGAPQITPGPTATSRPPITPPAQVEGDPNNGAVLYDSNCAICHGENGEGRIGAALAKNWPSIRPDLAIKTNISQGISGSPMPAWSVENGGPLTDGEISDIVSFIMTWEGSSQSAGQPTPPPTSATSSWLRGWGGVLVLVILLVLVFGGFIYFQRER